MPDERDTAYEHVGLELVEAIIRAEFQAVLLCAAVAIRAGAGRDYAGLNGLIASGDRRIAEMEAEQLESLAGDR
jgi:acid phosphatase family membrane protein YuiD